MLLLFFLSFIGEWFVFCTRFVSLSCSLSLSLSVSLFLTNPLAHIPAHSLSPTHTCHFSSVTDVHYYPNGADWGSDPTRDVSNADPSKSLVLGEYGGILLVPEGHEWATGLCHGYSTANNRDELAEAFAADNAQLLNMVNFGANGAASSHPTLSAAVYTEITDVETECNGLLTYDRLYKADPSRIKEANNELVTQATVLLQALVDATAASNTAA
jgi:hypothetical protein